MNTEISNRQRVAAMLAVLFNKDDAEALFDYAPVEDKQALEEVMAELLPVPEVERSEHIWQRTQLICSMEEFGGLSEIHPSWILEKIKDESPRIIGIILRYLPSNHVRYILENLPKRIKVRLPKLIEAFAVPTSILRIIRRRFERSFLPLRVSKEISEFTFKHLYYLSSEDIEELFYDLGINELALAFKKMDRKMVKIILNRLSVKDAKILQKRMRTIADESDELIHQAQQIVLEMSFEENNAFSMIKEIGINSLARSMTSNDKGMFQLLQQKLDPKLGYLLKRYLEQNLLKRGISYASERQSIVMSRIYTLSKAGRIDSYWSRFFSVRAA